MTLDVAIQFHPNRKNLLPRMIPELERADHLYIVGDPEPSHPLKSAWRTYRQCITQLVRDEADHGLIIQDDALPCPDLIGALENAILAQPEAIIVLCVCGSAKVNCLRIAYAIEAGHSWVELDLWSWLPTVAVCYPKAALVAFDKWIDEKAKLPSTQITDDPVTARFAQAHPEFRVLSTVPNLVEHPDDNPSLLPDTTHWSGAAPERVSCCYVGDCDALQIDWTLGP